MDRGGAARLQGLVWKRHWPLVSPFLGRSWGWGTFPQMRRHREILYGFPCAQCMRQAPGKRSGPGGPLHGGTLAQMSLFCNRGGAFLGRMVLLRPAPSYSRGTGLACAAIPPAPPSNVFENRGTRCTPGGGAAPCTLLGGGDAIEGGATLCNSTITCRYGGLGAAKLSTVICLA